MEELLFGQTVLTRDATRVDGPAFVKTGAEAAAYKGCFDYLWDKLKHECFSAAQLILYSRLFDMREAYQRNHATITAPKTGDAFFRDTLSKIERSKTLMAIDVAPDPGLWCIGEAYREFQRASIQAAQTHRGQAGAYHGRIFVVPGNPDEVTREPFIKDVIKKQYDAGVDLCFYHRDNLIDLNLAAADCIFSSDWGFYLGPGDSFKDETIPALNERDNTINDKLVEAYLLELFTRLKRHAPLTLLKRNDHDTLDEKKLRQFLIGGPI